MKPQDNLSTADQGSVDAHTSAESVKKQTTSFYRLTASALKEDYKRGLITATGYLYYIMKVSCKDGRSFAIDNRNAFCDEWGLSRGTFYDARAKCVALGLLERMSHTELSVPVTFEGEAS